MKLLQFDCSSKLFEPIDLACKPTQELFLVLLSLITSFLRKIVQTLLRAVIFSFAALRLVGTCFLSLQARDWFIEQTKALAADLADWLIWPFCAFGRITKTLFKAVFN